MKTCRTASIVAFGALFAAMVIGACREAANPEVPPVTSAHPPTASMSPPVWSGPPGDAGQSTVEPTPVDPTTAPSPGPRSTVVASFIEAIAKKIEVPICSRLFVYAARGAVTVKAASAKDPDTLAQGDVVVIVHSEPVEVKLAAQGGLAVEVVNEFECAVLSKPAPIKTLIRAKDVPEHRFADNKMKAQLLVPSKVSPEVYFGRLEGTAAVAEHEHTTSNETLIAIEAAGTFTIAGKEARLGPKQIVNVPRGTMHSWKPDPGSRLVAVQLYDPPGPEQRFVALAAGANDGGAPAPDGGKK